LNVDFDKDAKECLLKFNDLRNQLGKDLGAQLEPILEQLPDILASKLHANNKSASTENDSSAATPAATQSLPSQDILLAEADAVLALAEELCQENLRFEAMLSYHTAAVFYRVLMSMVSQYVSLLLSTVTLALA
jgi:prophage DNA circulation protein